MARRVPDEIGPAIHTPLYRRHVAIIGALLLVSALVAVIARQRAMAAEIVRGDPEAILAEPRLRQAALDGGKAAYRAHCASCHGDAGKADRQRGVPDLTDSEYLYGDGLVAEIEEIARHGIRSGDKRGWHLASMPAYATPRPYREEPLPPLRPGQVEDVTQFVMSISGQSADPIAAQRGATLYRGFAGCWDCHGQNASGDAAIGAPSLVDNIWLYGNGSRDDIARSIQRGRAGISPAFGRRLTPLELREVAVYAASLQPQQAGKVMR